jgi:hypothetical protein
MNTLVYRNVRDIDGVHTPIASHAHVSSYFSSTGAPPMTMYSIYPEQQAQMQTAIGCDKSDNMRRLDAIRWMYHE